jgi:type I site-specific restriction endonuclease
MNLTPEQKARVDIDAALVAAGWTLQNRGAINLAAGPGVAVREAKMAKGHGFADWLPFVYVSTGVETRFINGPTPFPMATSDFFRPDYRSAREAFLAAARGAGTRLSSHVLPDRRGPAGEPPAIDAAALGPAEPESLLLLISGTHGVEGLAGSCC